MIDALLILGLVIMWEALSITNNLVGALADECYIGHNKKRGAAEATPLFGSILLRVQEKRPPKASRTALLLGEFGNLRLYHADALLPSDTLKPDDLSG